MISVFIWEFLGKSEINYSNFMESFWVIFMFLSVTNNDVIKLKIIVEEARVVDGLQGVQELDTDLKNSFFSESFVSFKEIIFKSLS